MAFTSIDELESGLRTPTTCPTAGWRPRSSLAQLEKPLLLEGEAGVGKTEAAKALARVLDRG